MIGGVFLASALVAVAGAEEVIPQAASAGRYAAMREHCPFAIATLVAAPAPAQPSFAANWYVSGIARVGETDFVSVKARDLSSQFSLFGREPDVKSGVSLVSIEWVEGLGKSVVTIQKGTELAKLEFNESVVHGQAQKPMIPAAPTNGRGPALAVVPPPTAPAAKPLSIPNGFNPSRGPGNAQNPQRPGPAPVGTQAVARSPYQVPTGVSKPMTPYPRRPFVPANQAPR